MVIAQRLERHLASFGSHCSPAEFRAFISRSEKPCRDRGFLKEGRVQTSWITGPRIWEDQDSADHPSFSRDHKRLFLFHLKPKVQTHDQTRFVFWRFVNNHGISKWAYRRQPFQCRSRSVPHSSSDQRLGSKRVICCNLTQLNTCPAATERILSKLHLADMC